MNDNRLICLIPHYNNPDALVKSLASIGTAEACDVLVVDDGSTRARIDESACRAAFAAQGTLRFLNLPQNRGIEHALNAGLEWIRARGYELVARLDCGDENVADRFARQVAFLDAHPDVALVGGAAEFVNTGGVMQYVLRHPASHREIVRTMRRNSAFIHPAVMYRVSALAKTGLYPLDAPAAEDYALFWQFVTHFQTANLPEVLIRYELDPGSISHAKRDKQLKSRLKLQRAHSDGSAAALAGIARTIALLAMPAGLIARVKTRLRKGRA
ncbi:glycosyl transferase [Jeongeupia sp. HS-3]|uniref:glycosyltransferase n=1 Tax=Jeongeupia sp. HS-3 TaxID=1009682 RepID=UPI0018A451EB|nr:glycosyltransferase [Jeongeupia sp. HS-3]BCL76374.1 glycosyl transferase [Jeongeupia sp. HS-3]